RGTGCSAAHKSSLQKDNVSTNALRSKVSATARRSSGLSKGGACRFIMTLRLTFDGTSSQIASGSWALTSLSIGTWRKYHEVKSNLLATKDKTPVETFLMIVYSMPSR